MVNQSTKTFCHAKTQLLHIYSHIQTTINAFFSFKQRLHVILNFTSKNDGLHNSILKKAHSLPERDFSFTSFLSLSNRSPDYGLRGYVGEEGMTFHPQEVYYSITRF